MVFPTCVGVFLQYVVCNHSAVSSSPRAWGCFPSSARRTASREVFPTCVGVFLRLSSKLIISTRLPHVRGGVSVWRVVPALELVSSPRAWGCFLREGHGAPVLQVFPTCVGVFLWPVEEPGLYSGLPHVRGGVSYALQRGIDLGTSSPRAWGCFRPGLLEKLFYPVFPTCVGVFPEKDEKSRKKMSLPHVRGGVSFAVTPVSCI